MEQPIGNRKYKLTQLMLTLYHIGLLGYFILLNNAGAAPPDSFMMNYSLAIVGIGTAFTAGNIFEHRAKAGIGKSANEV